MSRNALFIDGAWRSATDPDRHSVMGAATGETLYLVPEATPREIDQAVDAARGALDGWRSTSAQIRSELLLSMREGVLERLEEIAEIWATEAGMPISAGRAATGGLPVSALESFAEIARTFEYEQSLGHSRMLYEPRGVAVAITPWNYPFSQVVIKAATAMAAGCTVVAKPSELAPGCAYVFAEITADAGVPDGVFNLLSGSGASVGESLVAHTGTDVVSFTGSTATGVQILRTAAPQLKPCTLELGGKSPLLILPNAPLLAAVSGGMASCFRNNGQTCTALTRFIVPRRLMSEVTDIARDYADSSVVGNPLDEATTIGPLVSASQWERVQSYIRSGIEAGASLVTGGLGHPEGLDAGYYVKPTVFTDVEQDSRIAREEIFGPVLSIIPYDSQEEAIRLANDSDYGLAASVWGSDQDEALSVGRQLVAGTISVNGGAFNPAAPYGGLRRSGMGHELGEAGFREFLEVKVLNV
ncbi:MAG: aldehyde dehydrogenase family protein [Acidimicrobiia bacterium]|nr:aldehyde dehydrogenase family protein [Acidimicrobiia bacterium]